MSVKLRHTHFDAIRNWMANAGFAVLLLIMTACAAPTDGTPAATASAAPTRTPTRTPTVSPMPPTATQTGTATATRIPPTATLTPTPTATPWPTLPPQGPYLMFQEREYKNPRFVKLDPLGYSRMEINLPYDSCSPHPQNAISPDGNWIAFYKDCTTLYLLSVLDGGLYPVAFLSEKDGNSSILTDHFISAWSPNGRYLAFVGTIEYQSDDRFLYVYDLAAKTTLRLTEEPLEIGSISWSPDGNWILFQATSLNYTDTITSFYKVEFDQTLISTPIFLDSGRWTNGYGWITPNFYFLYNTSEGCCGDTGLRYINIETGQLTVLWKHSSAGYAIDTENHLLAVSAAPEENDVSGFYFVDWNGQSTHVSDDIFWILIFRGGIFSRFIGFDGDKVFGISEDGSIIQLSDKPYNNASVSPDHRWLILYQDPRFTYSTIASVLFSEADQFVRTLTDNKFYPALWSPDSTGFYFYTTGTELYYLAVPDGEPILIDSCTAAFCHYDDLVWIP